MRRLLLAAIALVIVACATPAPPTAHRVESSPYHHEIQELARQQCAGRGGFLVRDFEAERWQCVLPGEAR